MGRHRRVTPAPAPVAARGRQGERRRNTAAPVRTGLIGVSAAMAMGAVAVASGLVPAPDSFGPVMGAGDRLRADGPELAPQAVPSDSGTGPSGRLNHGAADGTAERHAGSLESADPSRSGGRETSDSPERSSGGGTDGASDAGAPSTGTGGTNGARGDEPAPRSSAPASGDRGAPASPDMEKAAEAEVLKLVNKERKRAGCKAVTRDNELTGLAEDLSEDMAKRDFFSHVTPDGHNPWTRAERHHISGLGGENIARGQADADSVMDTWMDSPGHKANILNCEYRTLGVGAHFAEGGPWWTQDFGF